MKIKIKRIDATLPLPERKTKGAVAFDLCSREKITIIPGKIGYVPLNVVIKVPEGYVLYLFARSGTHKRGLMLANGVGVMDVDFHGDEDEINAVYYNFTEYPVVVERGERIAQGVIQKREDVEWEEVSSMKKESRGAFGTTGRI